jgi:hypothetical protein
MNGYSNKKHLFNIEKIEMCMEDIKSTESIKAFTNLADLSLVNCNLQSIHKVSL